MKCKHPDRPGEHCLFSDESGNQCVHCETVYYDAKPLTEAQYLAENGSLMDSQYFQMAYSHGWRS